VNVITVNQVVASVEFLVNLAGKPATASCTLALKYAGGHVYNKRRSTSFCSFQHHCPKSVRYPTSRWKFAPMGSDHFDMDQVID